MENLSKVILIGEFNEIVELCDVCGAEIVGVISNNFDKNSSSLNFLGTDADAGDISREYRRVPLLITPDNPDVRQKLVLHYFSFGFTFASLIHPKATISKSANIGKGIVIQNAVNISSNVAIADFVKLNTMANIMHDVHIGSYTTVAPNAVILGRVSISEQCYIGANATILPSISILKNTTVGASSVVTQNIPENSVVSGNPARIIKR